MSVVNTTIVNTTIVNVTIILFIIILLSLPKGPISLHYIGCKFRDEEKKKTP